MTDLPRFAPVADHAVLVEFATVVSDAINDVVIAADQAIVAADIPGVVEVVPALVNLLVIFDPDMTDHAAIQAAVAGLFPLPATTAKTPKTHVIDACYDADFGPDLDAVAKAKGISTEAVINAHTGETYRVSMYGFAPGYAYLSGVPAEIQVPRKTKPLRDIPVGRILIAGTQCLITTLVMPTGWSIIGTSPTKIMRNDPDRPFLFDVGDTVRFNRVARDQIGDLT